MPSNFRIKARIAAVSLAALCSSMGVAAQSAATSTAMVTLHPAVTLHEGDKAVGALDFSQPMHVVVTLKLRNEQQLDQYIAKAGFRPLSSGQFQLLYGPTKEQAQAVVDYLTNAGFSNVKVAAGNTLVQADGRADTAQAAFHTAFVHVKTHDGRDAFANSSAVQIPANLQDIVHAVLGVQNVHTAHVAARYHDPIAAHAMAMQTAAAAAAGVATGHQPSDFPVIYGASGMGNVTSVAVGSISAGPMSNVLADLKSVDPGVTITLRGDTPVGNGSGTNKGDVEWDLDSQDIIAFTGVKQYYFYVANSLNDADVQTDVAQVVSDNLLKAIDYSLYECEIDAYKDGTMAAMDSSFKQAVAQGQTFFVSTGDEGAFECGGGNLAAAWPSTSPYVTAVGGTELYTSPNTSWQNETAWDNTSENEGAGGGGYSFYELAPSWQQSIRAIYETRAVPDISFDASPDTGALITVDGQANQQIGGTSLAAPLATGMWAHVLQADGASLGFASPNIYKLAQSSQVNYDSAFHDVTSGNNDGFSADFGWDLATGWGSIIVNQFAREAAGFSSSSPVVSFGTLPALQATTPIPGSSHVPGDFNGDGISDLLWFNPSTSQLGYWTMSATYNGTSLGTVTRTGLSTYNVTPGYFVGAVGDFIGNGYADVVFTSANHDLWLWTNNQQGGWSSSRIGTTDYPSQWQLIGAGDVDGDGHDDLLWLDPSECKFGYWTMNGATVTGYHTINITCGYYPISIGYYTPSNRISIVWTSAANDLYIWDSTGTTTGGNMGNGFNAYELGSYMPSNNIQIVSVGGGYEGQNLGVQLYEYGPYPNNMTTPTPAMVLSRSFDANGNQTGIFAQQGTWNGSDDPALGSGGYVIAGNGVNSTANYTIDPVNMLISAATGGSWSYPAGWWVVGAPFNTTAAPPWQ
jgi:subtilase family serine protease